MLRKLLLIPKIATIVILKNRASVILKTSLIIPYPFNFGGSYPLSLKLFCKLSLIPKTPNRASLGVQAWSLPLCCLLRQETLFHIVSLHPGV